MENDLNQYNHAENMDIAGKTLFIVPHIGGGVSPCIPTVTILKLSRT